MNLYNFKLIWASETSKSSFKIFDGSTDTQFLGNRDAARPIVCVFVCLVCNYLDLFQQNLFKILISFYISFRRISIRYVE